MNIFGSVRRRHKQPLPKLGDTLGGWMEAQWAPSGMDAGNHRFLALQPIFNRQKKIFGYEALYRSGWDNQFHGDAETATQAILEDWIFHGLQDLTGKRPTFLNCTREDLIKDSLKRLPLTAVIELLETVEPDKEVLEACRRMKKSGYQIALDDFQVSEKMESLIEIADYIKVDFQISNEEKRSEIFRLLKRRPIKLIAEKIETEEEFAVARKEGFRLFQGYHLARPTVFSRRRIKTEDIQYFRSAKTLKEPAFSL